MNGKHVVAIAVCLTFAAFALDVLVEYRMQIRCIEARGDWRPGLFGGRGCDARVKP